MLLPDADSSGEMNSVPAPDDRPVISVIITSYNYAHYLAESVSSVLSQDVPSLELIVVDNASTDNTEEVIAPFLSDPRVRYYRNETNIGLTPNHNRALALVRGSYVNFVSADDRMLPGHLRVCLDHLGANPAIDMVYTGVIFIDGSSRPYDVRNMYGQLPVDYIGGRNEFAAQLCEGCYVPWPAMLARRALFDELGPLHVMTAADYEITTRWAAARKSFAYIRTPTVCIRLHQTQASGATYVADGHDLIDYLDIVEKFIVPQNWDLLQGHQSSIAGHLAGRAKAHKDANGGHAIRPELEDRIDRATQLVTQIPYLRPADGLGNRPYISVIVRAGTVVQLLAGLQSLDRQTGAPPWEAIVVSEGGTDFSSLLRARQFSGRVRFVRLDERNAPAAARNVGQRLAAGRIVTYLEPGNAYAPGHLAAIAQAFDAGALTVRSDVRFIVSESHDGTSNTIYRETIVAGLSRGTADEERDLIAPGVPIDAVAHLIDSIERTGPFRTDLPAGDTWEYWLRLKSLGKTAFVPNQAVDVRMLTGSVLPHTEFLNVAQSIYRGYPAADGTLLGARRNAYINDVASHFERGAAALSDPAHAIDVYASMLGVRAVVAAPAPV